MNDKEQTLTKEELNQLYICRFICTVSAGADGTDYLRKIVALEHDGIIQGSDEENEQVQILASELRDAMKEEYASRGWRW